MILGMDFGTTNSAMAIYDGRDLRLIPLDPSGASGVIDRTALYVTHEHSIVTGQRAIDRYLEQNVGRPARMERVRVGTIAVTAAEIGTYYRDVHIERDVLAPGRLFTSFKTFLSSTSYEGTIVGGLSYTLEDIVSAYLRVAKLRAERFLGRELRAIVLGRPVAFSRDHAADTPARGRLVGAALRAGYDTVYASAYRFLLTTPRQLLVLDHSGVRLPQLHGFDRGEVICALSLWDAVRAHPQLAVVTGRGVVRLIDMERVRGRLDRSIPFSLEKTTESDPIALVGVGREQQLAIVTTKGRALRIGLNALSFRGIQALKRDKDERIVGCVPVREPDQLLLVTHNGAARLIPAALVPLAAEPNMRGRTVAARAAVRGAARHDAVAPLWLLTSRYLRPVAPDHLRAAMAAPARKPFGLAALDAGEQVVALVTRPR